MEWIWIIKPRKVRSSDEWKVSPMKDLGKISHIIKVRVYKNSVEYSVIVIITLVMLALVILRLFLMQYLIWCINNMHCIISKNNIYL